MSTGTGDFSATSPGYGMHGVGGMLDQEQLQERQEERSHHASNPITTTTSRLVSDVTQSHWNTRFFADDKNNSHTVTQTYIGSSMGQFSSMASASTFTGTPVNGNNKAGGKPSYTPPPKQLPGFPEAERSKPKGGRPRWKLPDGDIIEWDGQHGEVEKYNPRGKHKGVWNPDGTRKKPAVPGRSIDPFSNVKTYNWRNPAAPWGLVGVAVGVGVLWESTRIFIPERNFIFWLP